MLRPVASSLAVELNGRARAPRDEAESVELNFVYPALAEGSFQNPGRQARRIKIDHRPPISREAKSVGRAA